MLAVIKPIMQAFRSFPAATDYFNKTYFRCLFITIFALVLSGCYTKVPDKFAPINADLAAKGLPFRWTAHKINGDVTMSYIMLDLPSGPTKADDTLKASTFQLIADNETLSGRPGAMLDTVKHLKDGREVWIVRSTPQQGGLAYIITFTSHAPTGRVIPQIDGPHMYSTPN
jgi:hypothetical protein